MMATNYYPSWKTDPARYSARCARIRKRKEERKDRFVRLFFRVAVVLFFWVVSLAVVLALM